MYNPILPDVTFVNINHRDSWQGALSRSFKVFFKSHFFKNIVLSIVTLGVYPYRKYKKIKRTIAQALASRKLCYFKVLQDHIEEARKEHVRSDPRQSLNAIFMTVQSKKVDETEGALEFKAIYYPSELFLFITNPVRDSKSLRLHHIKSRKHLDYLRIWHGIKKRARINQYHQIQNINFCNKTLKEEYYLTSEGIHDRLSRTSVCKKNVPQMTRFRELGKAFQEIVLAYQHFEEISETDPELYHLIDILSKTSRKDIETLQTYLSSRYLPRDLPLENRRQLIQLANQQEVLYHISKDHQFNLCSLILNKYQWNFLLSIQEVSSVTLGLLDWAFEECFVEMKKELSFIEKISDGVNKKIKDDPGSFPSINEKIQDDDNYRFMTIDFGKELNREWPFFQLYEKDKLLYRAEKTEVFTLEKLLEVYKELQKLCPVDDPLFSLLQEAFSQLGKQAFRLAIEEGVTKLLGTKSEYFLPVLSNSNVTTVKTDDDHFEIHYSFEQLITRKGEIQYPLKKEKYMIITQPLHKIQGKWVSPEAKIKIATKKRNE